MEDKYQRQITLGDAILNQAVLTFTNQDIPSYIKGGWLLRKAYKTYEKAYRDLRRMYMIYQQSMGGDSTTNGPPKLQTTKQGSLDSTSESDTDGVPNEAMVKLQEAIPENQASSCSETSQQETNDSNNVHDSSNKTDSKAKSCDLTYEVVERLLGSVSVGYGSFQLCISMVPPKILKIIELLGFDGDRQIGLSCLDFASKSNSARAPMAT